jgi:DNA-binding NarL/FixJ family response regulator
MPFDRLVRLAIADDHKIFRDGIRMALKNRDHIQLIWEAEDGREMMRKIKTDPPDILLMDIRMPELDGISALQIIRKQYEKIKVIVLSMYDDKEMISKVMDHGANSYLTKTTEPDEIYKAILTCINEDFYFTDLVKSAVLLRLQQKRKVRKSYPETIKFSEKELNILKLISEDKTTEEISEEAYMSPRTVESIRQNMKSKVGVKTIGGLLMYAMRTKLLE